MALFPHFVNPLALALGTQSPAPGERRDPRVYFAKSRDEPPASAKRDDHGGGAITTDLRLCFSTVVILLTFVDRNFDPSTGVSCRCC